RHPDGGERVGREHERHRLPHPEFAGHVPADRHVVRNRLARAAGLHAELAVRQARGSRSGIAPRRPQPGRAGIADRIVLTLADIHHAYAPDQVVTASISFEVKAGEFVSIVGPSGCGKTTLLKALSGLLAPTGGSIRFQGAPVRGVPDGLAMVFQEYG